MFRRAEVAEHGARAACLDARAVHQAERGHIGRAAALETRGDIQRVEAIGAAVRPGPMVGVAAGAAVVGTVAAVETAAVAGAAVRGAIVAEEMRDIREAEAIAAANRAATAGYVAGYTAGAVYPPQANVYVQPGAYPPGAAVYPPGAYPPGAYPPGAYPPGAYGAYPPGYRPY